MIIDNEKSFAQCDYLSLFCRKLFFSYPKKAVTPMALTRNDVQKAA